MLPEIPDNDTDRCWAPGCGDTAASSTGLCLLHRQKTRAWRYSDAPMDGRVYNQLDMRLNVFQESQGACVKAPGPCDMSICRFNAREAPSEAHSRPMNMSEPCALKLAGLGGMTLEDTADRLGVSRERARQLEFQALRKLRRACEKAGISVDDVVRAIAVEAAA